MTPTVTMQEALYQQHHTAILRYALRLLGNQQDAEDLAQQVFVKALACLPTDHTRPLAWLYTIARNLATDTYRHRQLITWYSLELLAEVRDLPDLDDRALDMVAARECIHAALAQLPERSRLIVQTYIVDDRSIEETARITGHKLSATKMAISRARQQFRAILHEMEVA